VRIFVFHALMMLCILFFLLLRGFSFLVYFCISTDKFEFYMYDFVQWCWFVFFCGSILMKSIPPVEIFNCRTVLDQIVLCRESLMDGKFTTFLPDRPSVLLYGALLFLWKFSILSLKCSTIFVKFSILSLRSVLMGVNGNVSIKYTLVFSTVWT